jgi:hypothetical protein
MEGWRWGNAWSRINCGIEPAKDNPEDKPLGHDLELDELTDEIPSNISPFWQDRMLNCRYIQFIIITLRKLSKSIRNIKRYSYRCVCKLQLSGPKFVD